MIQWRKVMGWTALACAAFCLEGRANAQEPSQGAPAAAPATVSSAPTISESAKVAPANAGPPANSSAAAGAKSTAPANASGPGIRENADTLVEGEKRFATNCGRCHQSPHHFPPRMMATIVRHMRVRATVTDEDMRLILRYMTQ